jgi:hypothetical protein
MNPTAVGERVQERLPDPCAARVALDVNRRLADPGVTVVAVRVGPRGGPRLAHPYDDHGGTLRAAPAWPTLS